MSADSEKGAELSPGCISMIFLVLYGLVQIYAGWVGIEYHLGSGWAVVALVAAFVFRFTLPITVGSFFGAMDVWGWPWLGALLFAAPGLAFMALMVPGALENLLGNFRKSE